MGQMTLFWAHKTIWNDKMSRIIAGLSASWTTQVSSEGQILRHHLRGLQTVKLKKKQKTKNWHLTSQCPIFCWTNKREWHSIKNRIYFSSTATTHNKNGNTSTHYIQLKLYKFMLLYSIVLYHTSHRGKCFFLAASLMYSAGTSSICSAMALQEYR